VGIADVITDEMIEQYLTDGVVCVKGVIEPEWIELLRGGVEHNIANPSSRGRVWFSNDDGEASLYDSQVWQDIDAYRRFVLESPMAEIAGRLMNVSGVNFFFDAIFARTTGTQFRTPFHQDEPYWSVAGFDTCSAWMPLVEVEKRSALEFVRGSHRWNRRFRQTNFGALTGDARDQVVHDDVEGEPFPDIEADRESFDIVSWDMSPGDVAVFNARMIHGGSGNLRADRDLRVFNTQWLGDDVRVIFRPEGMDPDHREVMTEMGLAPGDRIGGPLYPRVWERAAG